MARRWASAGRRCWTGGFSTPIWILQGGRIHARVLKHHLPNDAVFDEKRVFAAADVTGPYVVNGVRIGTPICEDAWHPDVAETLAETGAEILLVPNGSPYHRGKPNLRLNLMVARVVETGLPLVYLNMVGGQDDQVFDGSSMVLNPGGRWRCRCRSSTNAARLSPFAARPRAGGRRRARRPLIPPIGEADYRACVMGLGDYMRKTGFSKASWACRAGSTAPSSPPWPAMRWGRKTCAASCCRPNSPAPIRWKMRRGRRRAGLPAGHGADCRARRRR
jgi:hypothetical protein